MFWVSVRMRSRASYTPGAIGAVLPPRWHDARTLIRTGDSLAVHDTTNIKLTFGTLRVGVHTGTAPQPASR